MKKLVFAVIGSALLSGYLCLPMNAGTQDSRIIMLLSRKHEVFVSTRKGLFKSKTTDKHWEPVVLPDGVLPGGCLYSAALNTAPIYYSPPWNPEFVPDNCLFGLIVGSGLWASYDEGTHWSQVDKSHLFQYIYVSTGGSLYAAVHDSPSIKKEGDRMNFVSGGIAMESGDGGRTWRELGGYRIKVIGQCRKNHAHLCADMAGPDSGGVEYAPETGKWTVMEGVPQVSKFNPKSFPEYVMSSGTSGCCFTYEATLENYFRDFGGESLNKPGLDIQAGKRRYSFSRIGPKVIEAEIRMLPIDSIDSICIPDIDEKQICWGLEYVDPGGAFHFLDIDEAAQSRPARPSVHIVRPSQSYRRRIDLDAIADFSEPGVYKVAMLFNNGELEKTDPEDWTGRFSGQAFEVVISR
jgi:hypothetical protein